ncbi:peptidoglycan domain protein [Dysgonomonas sp. 521]|uniref:glycoside hydrolase family 108 protein n=1 Tax=Dysgonomonas sp. 521 TaxID=2302932 RepID=UPI0013D691B5|nr:glycosyl hydrolase 108 family protein [Dysgonomonas sp. 521]NDV96397.1 peptidoglycan domain protein [Dysgonomonas sp. 521]
MAKVEQLVPFILKWEGGYVNDPDDLGGATNKGITIATYRYYRRLKGYKKTTVSDLKNISHDEWTDVLKTLYWDKWRADDILSQPIANILTDWVWASGGYGIKLPQKLLGVKADGIVGPVTLGAVNAYDDCRELFGKIRQERIAFVERIVASRPANKKFRRGWLNRINDLKFDE